MHRIIYASEATCQFLRAELDELLAISQVRNKAAGLTGMLLFYPASELHPASFLQVLEGERADLEATYARISGDARHHKLTLLSSAPAERRAFGDWTMSLEYVTDEDLRRVLPGFSPADPAAVRVSDLIGDAAVAETLLRLYAA